MNQQYSKFLIIFKPILNWITHLENLGSILGIGLVLDLFFILCMKNDKNGHTGLNNSLMFSHYYILSIVSFF